MSLLRAWSRDLAMGARFACAGGREGWIRTLLTGVGVGLGVALLLITTALPSALAARTDRGDARSTVGSPTAEHPGPDTLLVARSNQTYRGKDIEGTLVQAEGPKAPVPPGLSRIPGPGELAVSPALKKLLQSPDGALLRERLDGRITETVGDAGLTGPSELLFYAGQSGLDANLNRVERITAFAYERQTERLSPLLLLLVVLTFVTLLLPVAVFVAAAVRFGGERRDRRLAALRLVGADSRMVRRIAAGEALAGSAAGLVLGAGFFLLGRELVGGFDIQQRSVFPADLDPAPWLAALVAVAVPAAAVAVTLFALRGVVIEPLGVVRTTRPSRRRLWWRLLVPLAGLGLLTPLTGRGDDGGEFNRYQVSAGVVLLLVGITVLLPWLLERLVGRLRGGPVSWQLAVRRLQVNIAGAARLVNGIAVAVAGAIALQMMFAGVEGEYTVRTGEDPTRATVSIILGSNVQGDPEQLARQVAGYPGITDAIPLRSVSAAHEPVAEQGLVDVTVGTCAALREVAQLDSCKDGDAFWATGGSTLGGSYGGRAEPGDKLYAGNVRGYEQDVKPVEFTVPATLRTVPSRPDPVGVQRSGLLLTPSVAPGDTGGYGAQQIFVMTDGPAQEGLERARTAAFKASPLSVASTLHTTRQSRSYSTIRTGLFFGATGVLILIGTSLLVSQVEQLRERRKLLSSLVAFGTRRSTLSLSVLWQTALPIGVGMALAALFGIGLGAVLMRMAVQEVRIAWAEVAMMTGAGAGVVALVTLLSLPPLLRLMRPDGLRTE
ncbi:ABC transporter permease [Streptomyces bambusae]|uniref:FtsX-like permease family protein n=1 Tax=Streptomyces bambusae TaxID=1550616 RepID=A0ABS6Z8D9_9ACTN|nr:FtsX-like permease family protein [Streptomyces bambusae]MBW5484016.1 FtsX-like permease family protein [Streptomyces bambusae]